MRSPLTRLHQWLCGRSGGHHYTMPVLLTLDDDGEATNYLLDPVVTCDGCALPLAEKYRDVIDADIREGIHLL